MRCLKLWVLSAILGLAIIAHATCAHADDVEVKIDNFTFNPQQVTVKVGDTVTWVNHDDIPHTVTSKTMIFRSKAMDTDGKFSFTFATPGIYPYFCALHPHMIGLIVVDSSAAK